jgi:Tfp pilus assembly major pilin PilA
MKRYIVELRYTAYTQVEVEAKTYEQAEALAWKHLEQTADSLEADGDWTCDSIEEIKE